MNRMQHSQNYINGQWLAGSASLFKAINPSNGESYWQGNAASHEDVNQAVQAAREAFITWCKTSLDTRITIIEKYTAIVKSKAEELASIISLETGKPLWESRTEASAIIGKAAISLTAFTERTNDRVTENNGLTNATRYKPHGVLAVFGPYNFPGHLANGHIIPALLSGNTVVFKPSELTPLTAEFLLQCWDAADLPAGVINLIQGEKETGIALAQHSQIDGVLFTGSAATGKLLHQQFAGQPEKILALELGGNNPLVVGNINDIDAAVYTIIQSAFITAGQRCTCARRLILPASTGKDLLDKLCAATRNIQIGKPQAEPQPFMGPVITEIAAKQLLQSQENLIQLGGQSLLTMKHLEENTGFVSPGIIDVSNIDELPDQEYFGPLLQVMFYDDFEQAIKLANNTRFGLSAGLISDSQNEYDNFFHKIRAGIVNWNRQITGASGAAPFGGIGISGNHRPSAYFAADYCAYPVASVESKTLSLPEKLTPGITL